MSWVTNPIAVFRLCYIMRPGCRSRCLYLGPTCFWAKSNQIKLNLCLKRTIRVSLTFGASANALGYAGFLKRLTKPFSSLISEPVSSLRLASHTHLFPWTLAQLMIDSREVLCPLSVRTQGPSYLWSAYNCKDWWLWRKKYRTSADTRGFGIGIVTAPSPVWASMFYTDVQQPVRRGLVVCLNESKELHRKVSEWTFPGLGENVQRKSGWTRGQADKPGCCTTSWTLRTKWSLVKPQYNSMTKDSAFIFSLS